MDLTEDEAHGLLFDREDDKGNFFKTYILLALLISPGVVLLIIDFNNWVTAFVLAAGFISWLFLFYRRIKEIHRIIDKTIDNYKITKKEGEK